MSSSSLAVFVAFVVALSGFSSAVFYAPVGYPIDSLWEHGLIKVVSFDKVSYSSPCMVSGHLVLMNPTNEEVVFDLTYPVLCRMYVGSILVGEDGRWSQESLLSVTIPARGEYVAASFNFRADAPGYYEVIWGKLTRGVQVSDGGLIPRLVADKESYMQYDSGYLTYEYYNPTDYPLVLSPPWEVSFNLSVDGVDQNTGFGAMIDWVAGNFTVPPHGSFKVMSFFVFFDRAGRITYSGMGLSKTFIVAPVKR